MHPPKRKVFPRLRRAVRWLAVVMILALVCTHHQARAAKLLVPTWFGMEPISDRVYVDKAMPADQRDRIMTEVAQAGQQIARYYGNRTTTPKLFFCSSEASFQSLGGTKQTGMTYGSYASVF